ncbi:hypothetical protein GCM10011410_24210 [Hoyosella rhizosphaerae]|uniref:DUF4349 domain-containing protein n=2 Tax=Hoyosella rhizosphaerae TaxID=1755582 RepID=A0A916UEZ1_9ACTN|nr:hypothetical protein GCM10011410_24210 [Hoyosella rhizosphaerae]
MVLASTACGGGDIITSPSPDRFDESTSWDGQAMPEPGRTGPPSSDTGIAEDREIIRSATMSIRVDDPIRSAEDAITIVAQLDGRVDERTERPETEFRRGSAILSIRVPAPSLDDLIDEVRPLGTVEELSISSTDVTTEVVDLDARLEALTRSVARLSDIMDNATSAEDLIAAENALSQRQAELESLQSRRAYLADQVDMSTLRLFIEQNPKGDPTPAVGFMSGIQQGWEALLTAVRAAIVGVGLSIPWVAFFSVGGLVIYLVVRLFVKRRDDS